MLVSNYELFKIHENKSILNVFIRLIDLINSLNSLGNIYTNSELMRKVLKCLLKSWGAKLTAI